MESLFTLIVLFIVAFLGAIVTIFVVMGCAEYSRRMVEHYDSEDEDYV